MKNEKRLIDANALLRHKRKMSGADFGGEFWDEAVLASDIKNAHTVDAVPVIRCRECKHWRPSGSKTGNSFSDIEYIGGCEFTKYCRRESDFCSYGERKENYA